MAEQNKERQLDQVLESLLACYSDEQPRPGLETRLLANLRAQAEQQKSSGWRWQWVFAVAGTAALVVLVALVVHLRHTSPVIPQNANKVIKPVVQPQKQAPTVTQVGDRPQKPFIHSSPNIVVKRQNEPAQLAEQRQEVFPTPTPLSDQEKLLLRYMARTPREEIVAQSRPDEDITEKPGEDRPFQQMLMQTQQPAQGTNTR